MVELQKKPFTTISPVIKTYDYKDLDAGLGFDVLYGAKTNESGNERYVLSDKIIYSSSIATQKSTGTVTLTFNAPVYNKPKTAKGTAQFSCGSGAGPGSTHQVKAQLFHMRGVAATAISSEINGTAGLANTDKMNLFDLPITEKVFATGDHLRIVVKLVASGATADIGHDPRGRAGTFVGTIGAAIATSVMQLNIPFKLR